MTDDDKTTTEPTDDAGTEETTDAGAASETTEGQEETDAGTEAPAEPEGDTFTREYVQDLRQESAGYRTQLRTVQERLHSELVRATGLLADPADLEFDPEHLEDPEALQAAIAALVEAKPHLKARSFAPGGAAQGAKNAASGGVDLLGMLRANA